MTEMFADYPDVVSIDEIQRMLRIGRSSAYELLKSGAIKSIKVGKRYIVTKQFVIEFLSSSCIHNSK